METITYTMTPVINETETFVNIAIGTTTKMLHPTLLYTLDYMNLICPPTYCYFGGGAWAQALFNMCLL